MVYVNLNAYYDQLILLSDELFRTSFIFIVSNVHIAMI